MAGLNKGRRGIVVDRFGVKRLDHTDIVDDFGRVRQQLADPSAALAMLSKLEHRRHAWERTLPAGHAGNALTHADRSRKFLAMMCGQRWLVVEQVDVRGSTRHEQIDDSL